MLLIMSFCLAMIHILQFSFGFLLSRRTWESDDFLSHACILASTWVSTMLSWENWDLLVWVEDEDEDCVPLCIFCWLYVLRDEWRWDPIRALCSSMYLWWSHTMQGSVRSCSLMMIECLVRKSWSVPATINFSSSIVKWLCHWTKRYRAWVWMNLSMKDV